MPTVVLPARCDRAAAETLLPELVALPADSACAIDASGVRKVGMAVLQLLVSARSGNAGVIITASPELTEAAHLCGLTRELFEQVQHDQR